MNDADDTGQGRAGKTTWVGRAAALLIGAGLLVGGAYAIYKLIGSAPAKKPGPQQIALIKQPPPPPPKPPEKPPEPQKIKEEVKIDEPKPADKPPEQAPADDKPASDKPLGLDADGAAGSDGFGLAANKGGRDMLGTGTGGGGSGRYFTGLLQRNFFDALARNRNAPQSEFSVVVSIWLGEDGRVLRSQIVNSSGDAQIDSLIQSTLGEMPALREVPPASMRQVQLRLNRRA